MRATVRRAIGARFLLLWLAIGVIVPGAGGCKPRVDEEPSIQGFTRVSDYLWILDESGLARRLTAEASPPCRPTRQVASSQESGDPDPGCTCVYAAGNDQPVFGRNFDWTATPALLTFHRPASGYSPISVYCMTGHSAGIPVGPIKRLTEEQRTELARLARGGVYDGMNDQGLVIGMNAIEDPRYYLTPDPLLPDIGGLGVMRKALNEAATVEEALDIFRSHNVVFGSPSPEVGPVKMHYLLADARGDSAIVEFVDGEMVTIPSDGKWQITTNFRIYEAPRAEVVFIVPSANMVGSSQKSFEQRPVRRGFPSMRESTHCHTSLLPR